MDVNLGLLFAICAMVCWGLGDFFIQKSVRKIGNITSLFYITFFGALTLTPFVYDDLGVIFTKEVILLLLGSVILFFAAVLDFEALKRGKLSVIEPLWSLEIVFASFMSFIILNEIMESFVYTIMLSLILGLVLVSLRDINVLKRFFFERGVFLGVVSASMMGIANFFMGWMARETGPLMAKWFFDLILAILSLIIIIKRKEIKRLKTDYTKNKSTVWYMCIFDNIAWTAYAFAMVYLPISIATAISESYIIIAVLLGMYVNKEKLKSHQKVGLIIALISAIILAYISA